MLFTCFFSLFSLIVLVSILLEFSANWCIYPVAPFYWIFVFHFLNFFLFFFFHFFPLLFAYFFLWIFLYYYFLPSKVRHLLSCSFLFSLFSFIIKGPNFTCRHQFSWIPQGLFYNIFTVVSSLYMHHRVSFISVKIASLLFISNVISVLPKVWPLGYRFFEMHAA